MSLCWSSDFDEAAPHSWKFILLVALDEFLFEDMPRYASLLSIWAIAGAIWFSWLDYLCVSRHAC
jgi:hypothetical protein